MKKVISVLLAVLTLFSIWTASVSSNAAYPELKISVKATDNYTYKITWSYDRAAVFHVYVDGKYDGKKTFKEAQTYTYTSDPYSAGKKHTIQLTVEIKNKIVVKSKKVSCCLSPKIATLSYKGNDSGYEIIAKVPSGTVHGFTLYKYNTKTKKYAKLANFKKSYCVETNSKNYKDTYKARAYVKYDDKVYYSNFSNPVTCTPKLAAVNLKSVKQSGTGNLKLTWAAVSGSTYTGYQIQYSSYDSFGTSRYKAVNKEKTSYTLKLIPGICYKVRMRTYRTVDSGKIYGDWSKVFTLYTKAAVAKNPNVKELLNKKVKVSSPGATGNEKLNNVLDKILAKIGCGPKSEYKTYNKVRLAYRYIATEQFKKDGDFKAKGNKSGGTYQERSTLKMIESKGQTGSCYEYNHLMHFLCLRMGLKNTYVVDGMVSSSGSGRTGHWWMMMKIAGNNYIFDPRMQRYLTNTDINFFCLPLNGSNKYSDYFRFYDAKAELK